MLRNYPEAFKQLLDGHLKRQLTNRISATNWLGTKSWELNLLSGFLYSTGCVYVTTFDLSQGQNIRHQAIFRLFLYKGLENLSRNLISSSYKCRQIP